MFLALAPIIGALLTLMNQVNSILSLGVGSLVAALVIHIVGLAAVCLVCLVRREPGSNRGIQPWLWGGGVVGVGTVFTSIAAFSGLGASLAVSLALLGQILFSVIVDALGLFGRKRYPPRLRTLPGIVLALGGIALMAGRLEGRLGYALAALASGALPVLSFTLNSQLSLRIGVWRGARANYLTGLATALVVLAVLHPPLAGNLEALKTTGALYLLGGGLMGVLMSGMSNVVYPRIPALTSTLLIFSGQALTGVLVDALAAGAFNARKLEGTALVLFGLAINAALERRMARRQAAS